MNDSCPLRRAVIALTALGACLMAGCGKKDAELVPDLASEQWQHVKIDNQCRVQMPKGQILTRKTGGTETFGVEVGDRAYTISDTSLFGAPGKIDLETALRAQATVHSGNVMSSRKIVHQEVEGLEFEVELTKRKGYLAGRIFIRNDHVLMVACMGESVRLTGTDVVRLFDTFKFEGGQTVFVQPKAPGKPPAESKSNVDQESAKQSIGAFVVDLFEAHASVSHLRLHATEGKFKGLRVPDWESVRNELIKDRDPARPLSSNVEVSGFGPAMSLRGQAIVSGYKPWPRRFNVALKYVDGKWLVTEFSRDDSEEADAVERAKDFLLETLDGKAPVHELVAWPKADQPTRNALTERLNGWKRDRFAGVTPVIKFTIQEFTPSVGMTVVASVVGFKNAPPYVRMKLLRQDEWRIDEIDEAKDATGRK